MKSLYESFVAKEASDNRAAKEIRCLEMMVETGKALIESTRELEKAMKAVAEGLNG